MQAMRADVFALKNSGLDAFLYADVGAEVNGSALTILSMLARLGKDPWAEAARWAALPTGAVIDSLAQSIAQMPLAPSGLASARIISARLVQLLPNHKLPRWAWQCRRFDKGRAEIIRHQNHVHRPGHWNGAEPPSHSATLIRCRGTHRPDGDAGRSP